MPGLFHKKSKSSLSSRIKAHVEDKGLPVHCRKLSMGSTSSSFSTDSTSSASSSWSTPRTPVCGPLSSHPPMHMNSSPCLEERSFYEEDEDRENELFRQLQEAGEDMFGSTKCNSSCTSIKTENCYFQPENFRRKTYVYDQATQWPLKDWQAVPPGFVGSDAPATPLRPRPANHQRRQPDCTRNLSTPRRDSAWKRQGMVFQMDSDSEDDSFNFV